MIQRILVGNHEGTRSLGNLNVGTNLILKWSLYKYILAVCTGFLSPTIWFLYWVLVNTVINLRVSLMVGNFMTR